MRKLVDSTAIKDSSLHIPLTKYLHIYAGPILPIYFCWIYVWFFEFEKYFGSQEFGKLWLIFCFAIHALSYLVCEWSVSLKALFTCQKLNDPYQAQLIKIVPEEHNGAGAICELKRSTLVKVDGQYEIYFYFQKLKYVYHPDKKAFKLIDFPSSTPKPFKLFKEAKPISSGSQYEIANEKYGPNKFDIPIPKFQDLFREHMVAPFFVFQLFCVALWFLDEMWYYSLFTLVMLFVFESTVIMQRLKNLQEFRTMSTRPYPIQVCRSNKWVTLNTDDLVPGDICSILRSEDECPVPCDFLLLEGQCIANEAMLSGESTPQLKESIDARDEEDQFDIESNKLHVLFGGTKILQVHPKADPTIKPPDGGCLAMVLKTGFSTQQGELVRMMLYSTERVTANNVESLFFILFLLIFAIIAASYVWIEGSKNEERKRSKVLLDCILILTSVVPPELPMELSLAVNNSLIALARKFIFCTEPFRIPFAGKIDVACFDKTGTLTAEDLYLEGVSGIGKLPKEISSVSQIGKESIWVMAAAHSLVMLADGCVGDTMEKNTLDSIQWNLIQDDLLKPKQLATNSKKLTSSSYSSTNTSIRILRRFPFSSTLKRMSTLSKIQDPSVKSNEMFVAVKGAPETLKSMFKEVPSDYDSIYKSWAKNGSRVLALGYKFFKDMKDGEIKKLSRDEVESTLNFAGFVIFRCPLKPDAKEAVSMLSNSSHRVVMITGDNALTACHVAKEVEICTRKVLIGDIWDEQEGLSWRSVDEDAKFILDLEDSNLPKDMKEYDLCITGKGLNCIMDTAAFQSLLPRLWVYARVSPSQKEFILAALKKAGFTTLMCGDGTNDVGALKQSHVGIALLNGNEDDIIKLNNRAMIQRQQMLYNQQCEIRQRLNLEPLPPPQGLAPYQPQTKEAKESLSPKKQRELSQQQLQAQLGQIFGEAGMDDVPQIKFGDASVAAPFTSKVSSVMSVCNIVRQGRSTLVAMIQMYKILALNCIISAYAMSVMYLAGIKQGDWQATVAGFLLTICFFGIAKSNALDKLSKKRPQQNIFNAYLVLSVLGQAAVHIGALIYIRHEAILVSEDLEEEIDLDSEFKPNILNSAVYLVSLIMHVATFAINYQGEPFRESLMDNKPLFNSLRLVASIAFLAATELFSPLNSYMQLVPFPDQFRMKLLGSMVLDFGIAFYWEKMCDKLFSGNKPRKELLLN